LCVEKQYLDPDDLASLGRDRERSRDARGNPADPDFQIRPIVDFDSPVRSAILARDQCVAFAGVDSNVATTTSSI